MASSMLKHNKHVDLRIRLIRNTQSNARPYDLPTSSEVAALIVGDFDRSLYHLQ